MPKINLNLKKLSLMRGGSLFGFGLSAHRDWKIILSGFMILIILSAGFSFLVFQQINNNTTGANQEEVVQNNSLDTELLKKTIIYYQEKAIKLEEIKSKKSTLADPAI